MRSEAKILNIPVIYACMHQVPWLRVVLDEAHNVKNVNAQQSKAATQLKAERRWAVTG